MADANDDSSREVSLEEYHFKQLIKVRVCASPAATCNDRVNLLAVSNKYGLTFVGHNDGFKVFKTAELEKLAQSLDKKSTTILEGFPFWNSFRMPSPCHLAVSSDDLTLSVCVYRDNMVIACFFDIRSFVKQNAKPAVFQRAKLSPAPGVELLDLVWNPSPEQSNLLAACMSNGSVILLVVEESKLTIKATLPVTTQATCLCWSPKGKQLVVGKQDGTLTQYDQALKEKKLLPCPDVFNGTPVKVIDVLWQSTYVFVGAYLAAIDDPAQQPSVVTTFVPKGGTPSSVNFDDICFGSGEERKHKYFFTHIPDWEMVVACSANALEASILGKNAQDKNKWESWSLDDSGRAELPLTTDHNETYPMGMAIDFTSQMEISISDTKKHPASPIFMVLSTDGVLVTYLMINMQSNAALLTRPPEVLSAAGIRPSIIGSSPSNSSAQTPSGGTQSPAGGAQVPPSAIPQSTAAPSGPSTAARSLFQTPATTAAKPGLFSGMAAQPAAQSLPVKPANTTLTSPSPGAPSFSQLPSSGAVPGKIFGQPLSQSTPIAGHVSQSIGQQGGPTGLALGGAAGQSSQPATQAPPLSLFGKTGQPGPVVKSQTQGAAPSFGQATSGSSVTMFGAGVGTSSQGGVAPAFTFKVPQGSGSQGGTLSTATTTPTGVTSLFGGAAVRPAGPTTGIFATSAVPPTAPATSGSKPMVPGATPASAFGSATSKITAATTTSVTSGVPVQKPLPTSSAVTPTFGATGGTVTKVTAPAITAGQQGVTHKMATPAVRQVQAGSQPTGGATRAPPSSQEQPTTTPTENPFMKSIMDEMAHFQNELRELKTRAASLVVEVGTKQEMQDLRRGTAEMMKFCDDIRDTTKSVNSDIHNLKKDILESFEMAEESKSLQERNLHPQYQRLLKSRSLDPASAKKMKEIRTHHQYVAGSLREIDRKLDSEWDMRRSKHKVRSLKTPTADTVYQTLRNNQNTMINQTLVLEKLAKQLQEIRVQNTTSSWQAQRKEEMSHIPQSSGIFGDTSPHSPQGSHPFDSRQNVDINRLAERLLTGEGSPQKVDGRFMSPEKQAKLRDILGSRKVTPVKSSAPGNLSMSKIVSAEALRRMLSTSHDESLEGPNSLSPVRSPGGATAPRLKLQPSPGGSGDAPKPVPKALPKSPVSALSLQKDGVQPARPVASSSQFKPVSSASSIRAESKPVTALTTAPSGGDITIGQSRSFTSGTIFGQQVMPATGSLFQVSSSSTLPKLADSLDTTAMQDQQPSFNVTHPPGGEFVVPTTETRQTGSSFGAPPSNNTPVTIGFAVGPTQASLSGQQVLDRTKPKEPVTAVKSTSLSNSGAGAPGGAAQPQATRESTIKTAVTTSVAPSAGAPSSDIPLATAASKGTTAAAVSAAPSGGTLSLGLKPAAASVKVSTAAVTVAPSGVMPSFGTVPAWAAGKVAPNFGAVNLAAAPAAVAATSTAFKLAIVTTSATATTSAPPVKPTTVITTTATPGFNSKTTAVTTSTAAAAGASVFGVKAPVSGSSATFSGFGFGSGAPPGGIFGSTATSQAATASTAANNASVISAVKSTSSAALFSGGGSIFSGNVFGSMSGGAAQTTKVPPGDNTQEAAVSSTSGASDAFASSLGTTVIKSPVATSEDDKTEVKPPVATVESPLQVTVPAVSVVVPSAVSTVPSVSVPVTTTVSSQVVTPTDIAPTATATAVTTQNATQVTTTSSVSTALPAAVTAPPLTVSLPATTTAPETVTGTVATSVSSGFSLNAAAGSTTSIGAFFGQAAASTTTSNTPTAPTIFGQPGTTTTAASDFKFVLSTPSTSAIAATTGTPLFGGASQTATTTAASTTPTLFAALASSATPATTTSTSLFQQSTTTSSTSGFGFGISTATTTTGTPAFGQASPPAPLFSGSSFAAPTGGTSPSVFGGGQAPSTSSTFSLGAGSVFPQPAFGQSSTFGQATSTGGGVFGSEQPSGTFGQSGSSVFGQTTSSSSVFGQSNTNESGGAGGMFGGGGLLSGLGGRPSAENANRNVFGSTQFGTTSNASSGTLFGNQSTTFGARAQSPSTFGGTGAFSGGGGSVAASGFGGFQSPTQPVSPQRPGFGGAPAFGGSPAFGSSPTFGGSAFGGAPTFGSSVTSPGQSGGGIFGSTAGDQTGGFASFAQTASPTFGALAQQSNTPSFGSLSPQQAPTFGGSPFGGGTAPVFGGGSTGFGSSQPSGSSFSSYRG